MRAGKDGGNYYTYGNGNYKSNVDLDVYGNDYTVRIYAPKSIPFTN